MKTVRKKRRLALRALTVSLIAASTAAYAQGYGILARANTPEEFAAVIRAELENWGRAGLNPQ
jgi:hypothetical protein